VAGLGRSNLLETFNAGGHTLGKQLAQIESIGTGIVRKKTDGGSSNDQPKISQAKN